MQPMVEALTRRSWKGNLLITARRSIHVERCAAFLSSFYLALDLHVVPDLLVHEWEERILSHLNFGQEALRGNEYIACIVVCLSLQVAIRNRDRRCSQL
jgi:hypothetical protein